MPDYNQGGFHDDGTGIYVDPTVQGSPSDYDTWDWKQIMAAITGGSALVPGQGGDARASSVSSPQTLVKAANDFQYVQQIMAMVAKSLTDQAKALAGGDGAPWQGGAADAFMDAMTTFSKQVASNAEALGGGSTGSSVAQNLIWSANALTVAQANIHSIDAWYANQAARFGVKPMANGLMPISQKPELVRMMTDDMRAELKKLASNYAQVNQTLGRVQPKPVVSPAKDPGSTGGHNSTDDTKFPSGSYEGGGSGGSGGPDLSTTGGGGSGGGTSTPDFSSLNTGGGGEGGTVSPFPGGTGMPDLATTGGGGTGDPGGTGTIAPFPGGTSTGGLGTGSGGTTAPESPQLNIPDTGTAGGPGGTVDPFTGGATTPDLPTSTTGTGTVEPFPGSTGTGIGTVEPFPGSTGTGTGTGTGPASAVPLPGFGSVTGPSTGNTGSSTAGQGLAEPVTAWTGGTQPPELQTGGTGTALPETGGTGTAALPNDLVTGAPGLGTPTAMPTSNLVSAPGLPGTSENGAGMPMMPMAPGMGAPAGAGAGAAERPDASGLLEGGVKPWTGGAELGALPEVEPVAGAVSGGAGLSGLGAGEAVDPVAGLVAPPELGAVPSSSETGAVDGAGAGMPMMPMAPGMGAPAGAGAGAAERPDASGLLESGAAPWTGGAELGASPEVEPVAGAVSGGAGLSGLDTGRAGEAVAGSQVAASSAPGAGEAVGAGAGTPFLPMMPGMGAAGAGAASGPGGERPDSSGLLEEGAAPWTGAGEAGAEGETEPVAGVPAGGSALSGTAATASATPVPLLPLPVAPAARGGTEGAGTRSGAGAAVGESTEASGLLGGSSAVWSPDDDTETAPPPAPAAPAQPHPTGVLTGIPTPSAAWSPGGTTTGREAAEGTTRRAAAEAESGGTTGAPAASAAQAPAEAATAQEAAETVAGSGAVVAVPLPDLPDDRVPVPVRSEAAEDTSTWDVAAAGFGMLMLAFAGQGSADGEHQESTTGYATAAPAVWDTEATNTVRAAERTVDPGTAPFAEPELTTWRPAARAAVPGAGAAAPGIAPDVEIRCGNGEGEVPDEPEAAATGPEADGEQEDEDVDDKGALDLLTQDASTWGARPVVPDSIG